MSLRDMTAKSVKRPSTKLIAEGVRCFATLHPRECGSSEPHRWIGGLDCATNESRLRRFVPAVQMILAQPTMHESRHGLHWMATQTLHPGQQQGRRSAQTCQQREGGLSGLRKQGEPVTMAASALSTPRLHEHNVDGQR